MDNRKLDIVSEGESGIALAMQLIWPNAVGGKAVHYHIAKYTTKIKYYQNNDKITTHHFEDLVEDEKNGTPTLIMLWGNETGTEKLPFPLNLDGTIQFVKGWLKDVEYGHQPDHDGSNGRGWRLFTENWGHVAGFRCAIVAAQPVWAMYGK